MRRAQKWMVCLAGAAVPAAFHVVPAQAEPRPSPSKVSSYVAIGDSYSAGMGIPVTTFAEGCLRSDRNFPSQLTKQLGITSSRDVSCSGARPSDTVQMQYGVIAPQFDALQENTQLVTVRIGINQGGLFGGLVSGCPSVKYLDPDGTPCRDVANRSGVDAFHQLADEAGESVRDVLAGVIQRAPRAKVVVVGYPRLAPDQGTCAALPLAEGDYAYVNGVIKRLDSHLASAAHSVGAGYVDMWEASRGHDICSARPWVQGAVDHDGQASPYHPLLTEHEFVAKRVSRLVRAPANAERGPASGRVGSRAGQSQANRAEQKVDGTGQATGQDVVRRAPAAAATGSDNSTDRKGHLARPQGTTQLTRIGMCISSGVREPCRPTRLIS